MISLLVRLCSLWIVTSSTNLTMNFLILKQAEKNRYENEGRKIKKDLVIYLNS
jgi:hypothetical protein